MCPTNAQPPDERSSPSCSSSPGARAPATSISTRQRPRPARTTCASERSTASRHGTKSSGCSGPCRRKPPASGHQRGFPSGSRPLTRATLAAKHRPTPARNAWVRGLAHPAIRVEPALAWVTPGCHGRVDNQGSSYYIVRSRSGVTLPTPGGLAAGHFGHKQVRPSVAWRYVRRAVPNGGKTAAPGRVQ